MAGTRRLGSETSETRAQLLDVTERLILERGLRRGDLPAGRLAGRRHAAPRPLLLPHHGRPPAGGLPARAPRLNLERQAEALASPQPLRALWDLNRDDVGTRLGVEFTALANHRPAIRDEIAAYAERFRAQQVEALAGVEAPLSPEVTTVLMASISRVLVMEDALGVTTGHAEVRDLVDRYLADVEGPAAPGGLTGAGDRTLRRGGTARRETADRGLRAACDRG